MSRAALAGLLVMMGAATSAFGNIVISGYLANPASTDSPFEYVQLVATSATDFAATPFSVVWANNGTATANGWIAGGAISYKFDLTSGTVAQGATFYVGGDGKLINGSGSTSIAGETWIRAINTATTAGDGFGTANSAGVFGNGGSNADGIAVFSSTTLLASTVPVDALFFGTAVGSAKPATGGYTLPSNDHYNNLQGTFGNGTNTFLFGDPASGGFSKLTGTYNTTTDSWDVARTLTNVASPTAIGDIASGITLAAVPEVSAFWFGGAICGVIGLWSLRSKRKLEAGLV